MSNLPLQQSRFLRAAFGIDERTLALFRVALALVLLNDIWVRAANISAFYSDAGVLPRAAQIELFGEMAWLVSLHMASGLAAVQWLMFGLALGAAMALLLGYRIGWATFISWALLSSLHNRNPMVLQGGDVLLRMLLFWSLFLPLGARFSLDQSMTRPRKVGDEETGSSRCVLPVLSMGTVAVLFQVCFVYWFTAALKTDPSWQNEGSALYYALSIDQMVKPLGTALLPHADLLRVLTFLTIYLERWGPLLALLPFWRLRLFMMTVFIGLHFIMGLCLTLGIFPLVATVAWLLFVPGQAWDSAARRLASLKQGRIYNVHRALEAVLETLRAKASLVRLPASPSHAASRWKSWVGQSVATFFCFTSFCGICGLWARPMGVSYRSSRIGSQS
jgi:hypothetical protein